MVFVIDDYVGGNDLVGLEVDLGPIALVGLVADIVGLTKVEVVGLVGLVIDLAGPVVALVEPVWLAIGPLVGLVVDLVELVVGLVWLVVVEMVGLKATKWPTRKCS